MSNRKAIKACEVIENDSPTAYNLAGAMEDDRAERELDDLRTEAYETACVIDDHIRPNESFDEILEDVYIAFLAGWCSKELRMRVPSDADGARRRASEWMKDLEALERKERRGGRNDRDRGSRRERDNGSRRDRGSRRERDNDRGRNTRRDRDDERQGRSRLGKGRRDRTREEEVVAEASPASKFGGKATVYDVRKFKLTKDALVENYDDHELNASQKPTYNKPNVEVRRIEFVEKEKEMLLEELETFGDVNDFINCTPDSSLEVGVVQKIRKFRLTDEIGEILNSSLGSDAIHATMQMISQLKKMDDIHANRLCQTLEFRAIAALDITANLYSRTKLDFNTTDALKEWEETQALFNDERAFDTGIESQFRAVFKGLLGSLLTMNPVKGKEGEDNRLYITSTHLAVKGAGLFCAATGIAGEGRLIRINDENHPELDTVATAALEIRDAVFGDAWSEHGMVPVIVSDSSGRIAQVISEKASAAKYFVNKQYSF